MKKVLELRFIRFLQNFKKTSLKISVSYQFLDEPKDRWFLCVTTLFDSSSVGTLLFREHRLEFESNDLARLFDSCTLRIDVSLLSSVSDI